MTKDKSLRRPAQMSLNFIVKAQHKGGGWRYSPNTKGDTSVVGWQIMALKSGHLSYLTVPANTTRGAERFLDSVQSDSGARYGYDRAGSGSSATTAIGLLCRMYLGWKKEHAALQRGVEFLDKTGPSKGDMYYNYYATQVMHHYGGEKWKKWNRVLRDELVNAQATKGHVKGSWHARGDHGSRSGGRLYCTAMAAMILEVYYRHLPLYGKQSTEEEFPF